jgi:hypothetical protein
VIYGYGEPQWNDIDRGKLIRPPEFSGNQTSSHLAANEEKFWEEMINLAFEASSFTLRSDFLHAVKSYGMGPS